MSESAPTLIVELPVGSLAGEDAAQALHWWLVRDGALAESGRDADPLSLARLRQEEDEPDPFAIALAPTATAATRWHPVPDGANERQANAAAVLTVQAASLQPEAVHVVARTDDDRVVTVAMDRGALAAGLARLNAIGIDPAVVTPAGWIIPPATDGAVTAASLGFDNVLVGPRLIAPDEPALREMLLDDLPVVDLTAEGVEQALASARTRALPNLRSGAFARVRRRALLPRQRRLFVGMAAALALLTLAIPVTRLIKLDQAAQAADGAVLALADPYVGTATDAEQAERAIDELLIAAGRGNVALSVPASALFSALQATPGVTVERFDYRPDGTVAAGLSAVDNDAINPALLALQQAGFAITATPRTDASGLAKADITVRAP